MSTKVALVFLGWLMSQSVAAAVPRESAISRLLDGSALPSTLADLRKAMDRNWGRTEAVVVPFSDAPGETDLEEARALYGSTSGELFVGTIHRADGTVDFEFISRNYATGKNDFGVARNYGKKNEEILVVKRDNCVTCHKTGGPIFPQRGWSNTLGTTVQTNPFGLFRAFLDRLAARDAKYRPFANGVEKLSERKVAETSFEGSVHRLSQKLGEGAVWHGIDLGDQFGKAAAFERVVVEANQYLVLEAYVREAATPKAREQRARTVLTRAVHGNFPQEKERYKEFSAVKENRPFILRDVMNDTFGLRVKGFDFSKEKFIEYHEAKRRLRFRNALPEFSPTRNATFVEGSRAVAGAGSQNHIDPLNSMYFYRLYLYFQDSDRLKDRFAKNYRGLLDGKKEHEEASSKFQKEVLDEFLSSAYLRGQLESGTLPTPLATHALFRDFVNDAPLPGRLVEKNEAIPPAAKQGKKCLDCHAGGVKGVRFNFEVSDVAAWKQELSSRDENRVAHARRWLQRTLETIKEATMPPPPFHLSLTRREKRKLIRFLEARNSIRR